MTTDVASLYETFPFPSPDSTTPLIDVVAKEMRLVLADDRLDGWDVLDAGCGTGHTLVGLAQRYPKARFVGLDACQHSLDIARGLAEHHGVDNVEFIHGTMPGVDLPRRFDLIISFGVLHHLPDPRAGLAWLVDNLAEHGLLHLWLYNALGEHGRMLDRELVQLLTPAGELASGMQTVRALGLQLSLSEYGFPSGWTGSGMDAAEQEVFDADAYLNPVVHPMRFADVPAFFAGVGVDWVAADRIYGKAGIDFVDLQGAGDPTEDAEIRVLTAEGLFDDAALRQRMRSLDNLSRARAIELRLRPTGFRVLAGRGDALERCVSRIKGNLLPIGS